MQYPQQRPFHDEELFNKLKAALIESFDKAQKIMAYSGGTERQIQAVNAMAAAAKELRALDACDPTRTRNSL